MKLDTITRGRAKVTAGVPVKKFIVALVAMLAVAAPVALVAPAHATTGPQRQAIGKAHDYLRYTSFSKAGLADQLHYEGFSRKVSLYAVNHIRVSWKKQAVKKAKEYLQYTHFSCSGLIGQLDYEKFTHAQSVYGAHHTRAC